MTRSHLHLLEQHIPPRAVPPHLQRHARPRPAQKVSRRRRRPRPYCGERRVLRQQEEPVRCVRSRITPYPRQHDDLGRGRSVVGARRLPAVSQLDNFASGPRARARPIANVNALHFGPQLQPDLTPFHKAANPDSQRRRLHPSVAHPAAGRCLRRQPRRVDRVGPSAFPPCLLCLPLGDSVPFWPALQHPIAPRGVHNGAAREHLLHADVSGGSPAPCRAERVQADDLDGAAVGLTHRVDCRTSRRVLSAALHTLQPSEPEAAAARQFERRPILHIHPKFGGSRRRHGTHARLGGPCLQSLASNERGIPHEHQPALNVALDSDATEPAAHEIAFPLTHLHRPQVSCAVNAHASSSPASVPRHADGGRPRHFL
eukprot:scaffold24440_cov113-Isochrysis_galbana.AAC.4